MASEKRAGDAGADADANADADTVSEIPLAGPLCLLNGRALSIYSSLARTRFNL